MTQWRSQLQFGASLTPVVKRLLIILVGIWFLTSILVSMLKLNAAVVVLDHLELMPRAVIPGAEIWQVGTYAWLHAYGELTHILFNAMTLFVLGPELERRWGGRSFLKFYILCGVFAGVFSVLVGLLLAPTTPIIGASGAIFGLLAAWSMLMPNRELLVFFVIPVKVKYLIWGSIGIDVLLFISNGSTDIAIQTHIGGAVTAWFLITGNWKPRVLGPNLRRLFSGPGRGPRSGSGRSSGGPRKTKLRSIDGGKKSDRDLLH